MEANACFTRSWESGLCLLSEMAQRCLISKQSPLGRVPGYAAEDVSVVSVAENPHGRLSLGHFVQEPSSKQFPPAPFVCRLLSSGRYRNAAPTRKPTRRQPARSSRATAPRDTQSDAGWLWAGRTWCWNSTGGQARLINTLLRLR